MTESVIAALVVAAVVLLSRDVFAALFARVQQPRVVAELCVGILVGSILSQSIGLLHLAISVAAVKSVLYWVSYPALIAYMFCLGYETDVVRLKEGFAKSSSIAAWAIVVPFALTYCILALHLAWGIDSSSGLGNLTICTVMAVTAFPVMSRILEELDMLASRLGIIALSAAAVDDLVAWTVLVALTAMMNTAGAASSVWARAGLALALALVILGGRYVLNRPLPDWLAGVIAAGMLALGIVVAALIGVDPILFAFAIGLLVQHARWSAAFMQRVRSWATTFMPLFFVLSGMNAGLAGALAAVPAACAWTLWASLTKGGAAFAAARVNGFGNREAFMVGSLMNCKGVVSLVFLSVALRNGLITAQTYTVLLLVALITTMMSKPLIVLAERWGSRREGLPRAQAPRGTS